MGQSQPIRVLVAEDEMIVGHDLCDTVSEAGYLVEGPFDDLSSAMLAFQKSKPDIAILDVQLGDGIVYPPRRADDGREREGDFSFWPLDPERSRQPLS